MAAPVKPSDFQALIVSVSGNLCAAFLRVILQLPLKLYQLFNYMFTSTGAISEAFLRDIIPSGTLLFSASSVAPTGYLLCNGAAVSRTDYAALFTAIGTSWGAGDGSTTFNVPDYRGRFPVGVGTTTGLVDRDGNPVSGNTYVLGATGGEEDVKLIQAELPAHSHKMFADDAVNPGAALDGDSLVAYRLANDNDSGYNMREKSDSGVNSATLGKTSDAGTSEAHNNLPPYAACFIYVKT
jgi:microcystin-dependent protein